MRNGPLELAWERRPFAELVRLSWPITVSTLSYSVMTLVDTLLVGRLGAAELAGVGLGGVAAFTFLCFSFGLLRGVKTLVAQAVGAGRPEQTGAYLGAAVVAALGIGALTIGFAQLVAELLVHLSASRVAGEAARTYLRVRILGAPLVLVYVALREVRYAQGDARSPMVASVIANGVNVALAWLFVFRLGLGVAGAAWATVIAHAVEAATLAWKVPRPWGVRALRREHLRELWSIGLPTGMQFTLEVGSLALVSAMLASLSELDMAAHQIALQVVHFSFLPAFAVAEAASVLTGQAVGARRDELVLGVSRLALLTAGAYTGACTIVMAVGAGAIAAGFTSQAALASTAVRLLYVAAVFQVFDGAYIVARAALRGTGDVRYPAVVGVVTSWVLTPPLTWLFGYRLGLGAVGAWMGLCAEIVAGACLLWWRLERRRWVGAAQEARARLEAARDEAPAADLAAVGS